MDSEEREALSSGAWDKRPRVTRVLRHRRRPSHGMARATTYGQSKKDMLYRAARMPAESRAWLRVEASPLRANTSANAPKYVQSSCTYIRHTVHVRRRVKALTDEVSEAGNPENVHPRWWGQQCQAQLAAIEGDIPCIHGPMNTSGARTWHTKKHITPAGAQNRLKRPASCIGTRVRLPHMQRWHLTSIVCMR